MNTKKENDKKRVGIISIHYGVNFGSSLQAFALSNYIKNRYGFGVEIINYIPPRYRFSRLYKISLKNGFNELLHKIIRYIRYYFVDNKYKRFLSNISRVSPVLYTTKEAELRYQNYDYLIAGSDQIWNSDYNEGIDTMYYLGFAHEHTKKIAYAASMGKTEFTKKEWDLQKQLLKDFFRISYREKNMLSLMETHGILGGQLVLDPTFLLTSENWSRIQKKPTDCPTDFLLMYFLDTDSQDLLNCAYKIAQQKGLKTVLICNGRKSRFKNIDYIAANLTPDYYIWLFRNANYIVTNSFHGVSFSINLAKQFSVFRRDKYNSRLESILSLMELTDRYITIDEYSSAFAMIDYSNVNRKKQELREKSIQFLDEALS